ncbi:adenylyl-sulfate kinase [Sulfoacidibacillus ferrooxidans]|uniref:adenylyl-sulfate kinase n=1 Tax=Sulfoacidibacillus ferrooxidans TaxID=2005001 RepID=UPI001F50BBB9
MVVSEHLVFQKNKVDRSARENVHGHKGAVVWLTGLSGSGKSTMAVELEWHLYRQGIHTYLLDGDNVRLGLNQDLGFSLRDREENIRRVGHLAQLFVDAGMVVIVAMISPLRKDREWVRSLFAQGEFIETFIDCPLDICIERDPKGLYKKALAGSIPDFTGISSPYEHPIHADLTIRTHQVSISEAVSTIETHLVAQIIPERSSQTLQKTHVLHQR